MHASAVQQAWAAVLESILQDALPQCRVKVTNRARSASNTEYYLQLRRVLIKPGDDVVISDFTLNDQFTSFTPTQLHRLQAAAALERGHWQGH